MKLFNIPTPEPDPAAKSLATSLFTYANLALSSRVIEHRKRFHEFWDSPAATPAEIVAQMGPHAMQFLYHANESVRHITMLVCGPAIANMTQEEIADKLHSVLPPDDYQPRLPLTVNQDGTVTIEGVEGLDAWGREIASDED